MGVEVYVRNYPQLLGLCWNRHDDLVLEGQDALALYERNWRFVDQEAFTDEERRILDQLIEQHGNGVLNI